MLPVSAQAYNHDASRTAQTSSYLEIGLGIGGIHFPDYPGADEHRTLLLPFPYIVYHSRYLDVNRDKVRGKLLSGRRLSLDVDFSGAVGVDSSRDHERQGMPNLDWIGAAGPALRYRLWSNASENMQISAILPVRAVVGAHAFTLHHRGEEFEPRLDLLYDNGKGDQALDLETTLSVLYGSQDYFQYIYGVDPQYATAKRPAYTAAGGYGGYRLSLGGSLHRGNIVYGAFITYMNFNGATFIDSPLMSRTHDLAFGAMIAWIFKRTTN